MLSLEFASESLIRPPDTPGGLIAAIEPDSAGEVAGLHAGDRLLAIDGRKVVDEIDVRYREDAARMRLTIERDGVIRDVLIRKPQGAPLGLGFAEGLFDGVRECNNRCSFCFLKGLPAGLRKSLYFKDDDYRLSFLYSNFVTLTNLSDEDWSRIVEERLSPLYVSVHATDPEIRRHLLGNRTAPHILEQIRFLTGAGIRLHTQLVITPGINDGDVLSQSIKDLASFAPKVHSIGVVPVGMTQRGAFRNQLSPELEARLSSRGVRPRLTSREEAGEVIRLVATYQKAFRQRLGINLVYAADEYYLRAGLRVPTREMYDGYPQFQNGIGMVRDLLEQLRSLRRRPKALPRSVRLMLVTGELAAPILGPALRALPEIVAGLDVDMTAVGNRFFGESVTAAGLLTTEDIVENLEGKDLGEGVLIPRSMLDSTGARFLDGGTPGQLGTRLGASVYPASTLAEVVRVARKVT